MEYIQKKQQIFTVILTNKTIQLSLLYLLLFSIPFILKGPQILLGSIINFLLIIGASQYRLKKVIPALLLPSIATYLYGMLFGGATIFLLYLIPYIFISNFIYVFVFKTIKREYVNILLASILKALFLFAFAYLLYRTVGLPKIFLTSMGVIQLLTAIIGGGVASRIVKTS